MNTTTPLRLSQGNPEQRTSFWLGCRQLWPFLKPYFPLAVLGIVLTVPVGALDAAIASFLKPFMDHVMIGQNQVFADYVPFIIVGFTIVQGLCIYFSAVVNGYVGHRINLALRETLFGRLLQCTTRFYDVNYTGAILYRFSSDAELASTGLISNIRQFLTKFFSVIALVVVLFYNSWQLTLLALVELAVLIVPLRIVKKKIRRIVARTVEPNTRLLTLYNETTTGSRIIKTYGLKEHVLDMFRGHAGFLFRMSMKMIRETNWLSPIMHLVSSLGVATVLYFGMRLILEDVITPGAFVSFVAALIMLYTPIKSIGNNYVSLQNALLAIHRIYEVLEMDDYEDRHDCGTRTLDGIRRGIAFEDVHFAYQDETEVLRGISFEVSVGQKVALVGPSGGGKSTICLMLPRLYEMSAGRITVDGIDIRDLRLEALRAQFAFVFQDSFMFDGTIRDNVLLGRPGAGDDEVRQALADSYLGEFVEGLPEGLDTLIGERGMLLSGGQKQRLAIARAMIRNAPLVILDEATSALDSRAEHMVQKALDRLMERRTTIVIAHRLSTVQNADLILVVDDGRIVERGGHEELLARNGAYAALYRSQFTASAADAAGQDRPSARADG